MVSDFEQSDISLKIIGTDDLNRKVRADVFAEKLATLIRAVKAADRSANGLQSFVYVISDLRQSSAYAGIGEQRISKSIPDFSGARILGECVASINSGKFAFAQRHQPCLKEIVSLAKDVGGTFKGGVLRFRDGESVTLDSGFYAKAVEASKDASRAEWFKGSIYGSLEGVIEIESIRGGSTTMEMRLSSVDVPVKCVCPNFTSEDIKPFFGQRVRVNGLITYSGDRGLPDKIEITTLPTTLPTRGGVERWKGAFEAKRIGRGFEV
jgi:hypothetical protein